MKFARGGNPIYGPICIDDFDFDPTATAPCGTFVCRPGFKSISYGTGMCCCDTDDEE